MLGDLAAFFSSVILQWTAWVTGTVVAALLFILERRSNNQVPWHIIRWVFVWGGLLVAVFWAWQEEHTKVAQLGPDFSVVLFWSDFVLFSEKNHVKVPKNQ